jgi:hypothetical protein
MASLSDLPELIGFFSYSREDDESFKGTLSALRDGIQREFSAQLGRSKKTFRLWQDQEAIAPGTLWESEIKTAVEKSVFFPLLPRHERSTAIIANSSSRRFSRANRRSVELILFFQSYTSQFRLLKRKRNRATIPYFPLSGGDNTSMAAISPS